MIDRDLELKSNLGLNGNSGFRVIRQDWELKSSFKGSKVFD